jgi:hypothetical protein
LQQIATKKGSELPSERMMPLLSENQRRESARASRRARYFAGGRFSIISP